MANIGYNGSGGQVTIQKLSVRQLMKNDKLRIAKYVVEVHTPGLMQTAARFVKSAATTVGLMSTSNTDIPKVLMVVGATGAGKTTLINGFANYLLGVTWEDNVRYKLISETKTRSDAYSQTTWISAYTFPKVAASRFPYALTIIDTPGFGDTDGVDRDKEIAGQIKEFFSLPPPNGIDHIDAIGFVAQASQSRLTPAQSYIFQAILATFGKDIGENIFLMATFADGGRANVLDSIQAANIPFVECFKFNNSALYQKSDSMFDKLFWEMGTKSFEAALTRFFTVTPKSLLLTREVLRERDRLETVVKGLQEKVRVAMGKIEELQQEQKAIEQHKADIKANKDFEYEVEVLKMRKVDLPNPSTYVTNCSLCGTTCHYPCGIPLDKNKDGCWAITDGRCRVCPSKCYWYYHCNSGYRFDTYYVTEMRTYEELKTKYEKAMKKKCTTEDIVKEMETELHDLYVAVCSMIQEARRSLNRLKEIALKPDPLTEVGYINILIAAEKQKADPGYMHRVECLQKVREMAELMGKMQGDVISTYEGSSWWDKFRPQCQ